MKGAKKMNRQQEGIVLISKCKEHLVSVLQSMSETAPDGKGLPNKEIEHACGFELHLPKQDGWFTWSLLRSLTIEGRVEILRTAAQSKGKYRLTQR